MDSILICHPLNLGHLMIRHMIVGCYQVKGHVLSYGNFFTRFFTWLNIDISCESNHEELRHFDAFSNSLLSFMRRPKGDKAQHDALAKPHREEEEICDMEDKANP